MNIALSKELEQLIQDKVKSGRYLSASEVVGEALRLLDERDSRLDSFSSRLQEAELEEDIRHTAANANIPQGREWPPGFFEETFGAFKDDPLVIDSEGIFEDEEEFN